MRKSVAPFNFIFCDTFDVESIREEVEHIKEELLIKFDPFWSVGSHYEITKNQDYRPFLDSIQPIISQLEVKHDGRVGSVKKVKVKSFEQVKPKMDKGDYADIARRHIIPIFTSDKVTFTVGGESMNVPIGACVEVNNVRVHQLTNNSTQDHTHLQIDILPDVWFE